MSAPSWCWTSDGNATFQQEGANLIDDAGALADQPLPHAAQRLQIKLIGSLHRHELHRRPRTASAIASLSRKSFFCRFEDGRTYFAGISRASCASTCSLQVGEPRLELPARAFPPQHDRAALILTK